MGTTSCSLPYRTSEPWGIGYAISDCPTTRARVANCMIDRWYDWFPASCPLIIMSQIHATILYFTNIVGVLSRMCICAPRLTHGPLKPKKQINPDCSMAMKRPGRCCNRVPAGLRGQYPPCRSTATCPKRTLLTFRKPYEYSHDHEVECYLYTVPVSLEVKKNRKKNHPLNTSCTPLWDPGMGITTSTVRKRR